MVTERKYTCICIF